MVAVAIGEIFGRLTVVEIAPPRGKYAYFICRCVCGTEKEIYKSSLTRKMTTSCGCFFKEQLGDRVRIHGMAGTSEYRSWKAMLARCNLPSDSNYKNYGARGISVCSQWVNSFENFYADMGPRLEGTSLERDKNNGNYEPTNCRWATPVEQCRNRRSNLAIEYQEDTKTLAEWCEVLAKNYALLYARLYRYGWSIEKAFTP